MNKKSLLNSITILLAGLLAVFAFYCKNPNIESEYFSPKTVATHFNGEQFVGSETCLECHADIYAQHIGTAHFNTSAIADSTNINGSFEKGANMLDLKDVAYVMKKEGDSFYQHTRIKNRDVNPAPSKFDLVIGSGVRGQTYLTWEEDALFQLQPSYHTPSDSWINSPGYPTYNVKRPISDACLKCHVTFATNTNAKNGNVYDKEKMLYGVDCERCHRPAAKHVVYHRNNPEDSLAKHMLKLAELPKQQRLDACAQCHSGLRQVLLKGSPLSFLVGEDLSEHSQNYVSNDTNGNLDVHGNQYGLLTKSKCFKQTETMDCSTCHNPHKNQRGDTDYFNQKCMQCHSSEKVTCNVVEHEMEHKNSDCIACHMPSSPSKIMMAQVGQDSVETSFFIRTHLIAIYPEEQWNN
ncbi:multiheme c-type cytochrome [Flagellimonas sp.]|uniref:multiheme c-type cytochrome n=1 Tax=Flagellimonas sp. TaxID=2058762 RepID=UPI003B50B1BE